MQTERVLFEEIFSLLAASDSPDDNLQVVLDRVVRRLDFESGAIFLLDPMKRVLTRRAGVGLPQRLLEEYDELRVGEGIIGEVAETGIRIVVRDTSGDDRVLRRFIFDLGLRSFVSEPIRARGEVLGVLNIGSESTGSISKGDLSLLAAVAGQIGIALDNARLLHRSRRSEQLYRHLLDHAPDLNFLCDTHLRLIRINRGGLIQFGLEEDGVVGKTLGDLLGEKAANKFSKTKDALVQGERELRPFEMTLHDRDGAELFYEFRANLIREGEDRFFLHFVGRDLTRRRELESRLRDYAEGLEHMVDRRTVQLQEAKSQMAYLFEIATRLPHIESVAEKLELIVGAIVQAGLFRKVMIRIHDAEGTRSAISSHGYVNDEATVVEDQLFAPRALQSSFLGDASRVGVAYLVTGIGGESRDEASELWASGDRLIVPLERGESEPLGFLVAEDPIGGRRPTEELVQVLELFVSQAALAVEEERLARRLEEADRLKKEITERYGLENIVGDSKGMRNVFDSIWKLGEVRSSVLITGESGTGKELVASAIHYNGARREGPFVKINCAAIPEMLLESELFGIEERVATGVDRRMGKFEQADGGSLLLDEVADMSMVTQAKVLRILQERIVERVGGDQPRPVDVRILAATNRDLQEEMEAGRFRRDLYYRLHVVAIHLPALRERREDIPALVDHQIRRCCEEQGLAPRKVSPAVMRLFHQYPWPGNVRQLNNCLERSLVMGGSNEIVIEDLPPALLVWQEERESGGQGEELRDLAESLADYEREMIRDALERTGWIQSKAARLLGISERAMWYRVKKLKIPIPL